MSGVLVQPCGASAGHDRLSGTLLPAGDERLAADRHGHDAVGRGERKTCRGLVQFSSQSKELHAASRSGKSSLEEERLCIPQPHENNHQERIVLRQLELKPVLFFFFNFFVSSLSDVGPLY